jgi:hypothetical protein
VRVSANCPRWDAPLSAYSCIVNHGLGLPILNIYEKKLDLGEFTGFWQVAQQQRIDEGAILPGGGAAVLHPYGNAKSKRRRLMPAPFEEVLGLGER